MITDFGAAAACFFATLLAMTALRPLAVAVNLVDRPGGRKTHRGDVPVVGGIAMFMGCTFGLGLLPSTSWISASLLSAAALVVLIGMLDDRFEISPFARLTAHLAAALLVLTTSVDLSIHTLGSPFGTLTAFSDWQSAAFTCVAIMGAINAFNMLDGMDGLAGTMAFNALVALLILSTISGDLSVNGICMVLSGAVAAFLIFNIPARFNRRVRCFMGDAGSTLLGFLLACLCIRVSQGESSNISPTTTLWVVAIPLYELLWTTIRRMLKGRSPFQPDRAHFHHNLQNVGFRVRGAFLVLISFGALFAAAGICLECFEVRDSVSFGLWVVAGATTILIMRNAQVLWCVLPKQLRRGQSAENSTA